MNRRRQQHRTDSRRGCRNYQDGLIKKQIIIVMKDLGLHKINAHFLLTMITAQNTEDTENRYFHVAMIHSFFYDITMSSLNNFLEICFWCFVFKTYGLITF